MKKILSLVLVLVIVMSSFGSLASNFDDIADVRTMGAANRLSKLEILEGFDDGSFRPDGNLTREQFATAIVRALGLKDKAETAKGTETGFSDVKSERWSSGYIKIAANEKIINGVGENMFAPSRGVKYEEAVTMVIRALKLETPEMEYPAGYLKIAEEEGLLKNLEGVVGEDTERSVIAKLLDNSLEKLGYEVNREEDEAVLSFNAATNHAELKAALESKVFKRVIEANIGGEDIDVHGYGYFNTRFDMPLVDRNTVGRIQEGIIDYVNEMDDIEE